MVSHENQLEKRLTLFGELQELRRKASTNNTTRDRLVSVFDELINNDDDFKSSPIKTFNTLDAGTRNMIYNNQDLMKTVLGNIFKTTEGEQLTEEQSEKINEFLKNLQSDLENNEYSLINHPENDDAINWLITQLGDHSNENKIHESEKENFKTNLNAVRRLMEFQKIRRELLRNNLYYKKSENTTEQQQEEKKPENTTEQQQKEKKSQTPTLDSFIDSAESKEDIEQVGKLIKDVKFENFGDLRSVADKYVDKRKEIIKEENIKKDDIVIDYINNLTEEELQSFIDNTLLGNSNNKSLNQTQCVFLNIIALQNNKVSKEVERQTIDYLIANPNIYNLIKTTQNFDKKAIDMLIQKYQDVQLIDRDKRTVLEELALSGNEESIKELKNKIKNGEELTESMKNMLLLYSDPTIKETKKETKKERKNQLDKLKQEKKEMDKNIEDNNKKIKKIDDNIKDINKNMQINEETLRKKQEELYTNYDKSKGGLFGKINFEKNREKLRNKISSLQRQIEIQRGEILLYQQNKQKLEINNNRLKNKTQQINKHTGKQTNEGLQGLYKLNKRIDNFKKKIKGESFSEVIEMLEATVDNDINTAILNSYCKNTDKLNDKDFKDFLDYCIKINDSLEVDDGVKKPLDVLLEKDSLKKLTNDRIYGLLHNEKLKGKTENILNNLPDNKLSTLISKAVEQIEDNTEIEDDEEKQSMEAKKGRNREIINTLNDAKKINTLQKDGKFETINTLIDYAKTGFNKEDPEKKDNDKIGIMNNIVSGLSVEKIDETKSQEEIDKQNKINEQVIQTLKNLYEIYGDNEQTQQQNEIIEKFTDSVENLVDTPELLSEVIDFAEENLKKNKKPIEKEKEDKQKENTKETIGLLNTVVKTVTINKIQDGASSEKTDKQKEINKQTIQTLKRVYKIYGDNEQTEGQNKIIEKFTNSVGNLIDTPELLSEVIDFADSLYDEEKEDKKEEKTEAELSKDREFEEGIYKTLSMEIDAINNKPENETEEEKQQREKTKQDIINNLDEQIKKLNEDNENINKNNEKIKENNKKIDENITEINKKINKKINTINEIIQLKEELKTIENNGSKGKHIKNLEIQEKQRQINEKCKTIEGINNNLSIDDLTKQIETLKNNIKEEKEKKTIELKSKDSNNKKIERLTEIRNAISEENMENLKSLQMKQAEILDDIDKQIDKNKTKTERRKRKNAINKEIINKTVIPEVNEKPTEKELQNVQDKIKLLVKISKNNKDLVRSIQGKIQEPINKLIENKKIDTVLKIASESGNLIGCLDNETVNGIYDKIKDRKFGSNSLNNRYLADTLIQIYNSYNKDEDKKNEKEKILNKLLSLTPKSLVFYIQNNEICDDLLLKLIEQKQELLHKIKVNPKNEKIIEQVNKILENDKIKLEDDTKTKLQEFTKQYKDEEQIVKQQQAQQQNNQQKNNQQQNNQQQNNEQQNNQQQNNQQQNNEQQKQNQTQQSNSTAQNNEQQQETNQQENQSNKKTNNPFSTFTDFLTKPQEFMKDCSKNPVKMMELMLTMNMLSGNGIYPFYSQGKMSEKSYQKYINDPDKFMDKFTKDPMKFVGMIGSSSDKLQSCFQTYLDKNNGKYPEGVTMALCTVATYLNNAQQMMAYNNGAAMPNQPIMGYNSSLVMLNQPMMYGGGYGVPYGTVGNIALPSTFYATAVSQIRFEQGLLSEWKKQNKIAKKKLELKKQEIAEIKRGNDIAELKQVGKFFSNSKIKGEEVNNDGKIKITYTGPNGGERKYEVTIE